MPSAAPMIREETPRDYEAVATVNRAAFGQAGEAELVDRIRGATSPLISIVAERDGAVIGHVLFSPVTVHAPSGAVHTGLALGPVAVAPPHQRRGVGTKLIQDGLERCRALDAPFVVVLGHPEYYPRFGFEPAFSRGMWFGREEPIAAFMVLELRAGGLDGVEGEVRYRREFEGV